MPCRSSSKPRTAGCKRTALKTRSPPHSLFDGTNWACSRTKPFRKSARIVRRPAWVKYHPHGGQLGFTTRWCALRRIFSTRYMLVEGHGNFWQCGDGGQRGGHAFIPKRGSPKMSQRDDGGTSRRDTVDFIPNFDENADCSPSVLPSRFPKYSSSTAPAASPVGHGDETFPPA